MSMDDLLVAGRGQIRVRVGRALLLILFLLAVACTGQETAPQPPEIRYGEDVCDQCRMIISEARYAAAYLTTDGQPRRFDDIGGMIVYQRDSADQLLSAWVHDYETEAWITAEAATFVIASEPTPMGSGLVAFAEAESAQRWAQEHDGMVIDYSGLLDLDSPMTAQDSHEHN